MPKIPDDIQRLLSKEQKSSKKQRKYSSNKRVPLPAGMPRRVSVPKKFTSETKCCSINRNYLFFNVQYSKTLKKRKIINKDAKEKLIAIQKMKIFSHEMQQWICKELGNRVSIEDEPIEFYDLLQKREERHFQIDRVIRYLST